MSELAQNFINVETERGFRSPIGRNFTARLTEMVSRIDGALTVPERTLWFPPGEYRIYAPFTFPAAVTLSFAPGALIIPLPTWFGPGGVSAELIEIAGVVEAPLTQIFASGATTPAGTSLGRIVFTGDGTPRVYPEWWGAGKDPQRPSARADTAAIREAIRAAVIDREALTQEAPRYPVAITFLGSYQVNDVIHIRPATELGFLRTMILEGLPGQEGARISVSPELSPDGSPVSLAQVFSFERVVQIIVRNLKIHAQGRSNLCMLMMPYLIRSPLEHTVLLEGCTFEGARDHQVFVLEISPTRPAGGSLSIRARGCNFTLSNSAHARFDADHRSTVNGLYVQGTFGANLTVDACVFEGYFFRGVLTLGGVRSVVTGCTFRFRSSSSEMLPNGAALVLERSGIAEAGLPTLEAACCDAATPSFLWVEAPQIAHEDELPIEFNVGVTVVLTAITHRVDRTRALGLYWPPAVVWRGGPSPSKSQEDPPGRNSQLTLIGCLFEVPTITPQKAADQKLRAKENKLLARFGLLPRVPRVVVNATVRRVFNVGTFRADFPSHAIGTFRTMSATEARSLGPGEPVSGPAIAELTFDLGRFRRLFAWADW